MQIWDIEWDWAPDADSLVLFCLNFVLHRDLGLWCAFTNLRALHEKNGKFKACRWIVAYALPSWRSPSVNVAESCWKCHTITVLYPQNVLCTSVLAHSSFCTIDAALGIDPKKEGPRPYSGNTIQVWLSNHRKHQFRWSLLKKVQLRASQLPFLVFLCGLLDYFSTRNW